MTRPFHEKSSIEQIRQRFDADVERFSKLETGQQAAMDAVLILDLVAKSAKSFIQPHAKVLDLGCGAGNFTLRVLQEVSPLDCVLVDLSVPMLERARQRLEGPSVDRVATIQSDMRALTFEFGTFDLILAGQSLHHLRGDDDWRTMFAKLFQWLKPGGVLFVADFVEFDHPGIQGLMKERYGAHLVAIDGEAYRDKVFAYTEIEDSPRSIQFQLELLQTSGFAEYDVLHRNALFAAYYARKSL